jgi:hypothetical protein
LQRRLIYMPSGGVASPAAAGLNGARVVALNTSDGLKLGAWFVAAAAPSRGDRILYYGESLGAAVVVELATEHPPAGLVLRSPFVDLAAVGQIHFSFLPVRMLLRTGSRWLTSSRR